MNEVIERDRSHLENSRPFPWDRTCDSPNWEAALDHLLGMLEAAESRRRARRIADKARLRSSLGAMLLGLYATWKGDPQRWLAYSRNNSDYGPRHPYVPPLATAKVVSTAADFLAAAGFAEHRRGSYTRTDIAPGFSHGWGYRSRIRATSPLIELLEGGFGLSTADIRIADWASLVRLKSAPEYPRGPKRLMPYEETDETRRMRAQLRELNSFLAGFEIDLEPGPEARSEPEMDAEDIEEQANPADRSTICLYRVFNNGRFDHGGRLYGGWWQNVSKRDRRRLLIDGEETVELDFKALHPRLCYHLEGQPLPESADPYLLPDLDRAELRDLIKVGFNQLLNAPPTVQPKPHSRAKALPDGMTWTELLDRIEAAHAPLRHWFRQGRGVELQRIDSDMASSILSYLQHRGVCCLPVHDSFIVPRSAEFLLGQTMCMAYHGALSRRTMARAWPVIAGWTSTEVEQQVIASLP